MSDLLIPPLVRLIRVTPDGWSAVLGGFAAVVLAAVFLRHRPTVRDGTVAAAALWLWGTPLVLRIGWGWVVPLALLTGIVLTGRRLLRLGRRRAGRACLAAALFLPWRPLYGTVREPLAEWRFGGTSLLRTDGRAAVVASLEFLAVLSPIVVLALLGIAALSERDGHTDRIAVSDD